MFCIILIFLFCDQIICVCDSCVHLPAECKRNSWFPATANTRAQPCWCKPWFKWGPCHSKPSLTRNYCWVCTYWASGTSSALVSASNPTHLSRTSNELSIWGWDTRKNQKVLVRSWLWEGSVCSCMYCKKVMLDFADLFLSKYYCFAVMRFIYQFLDINLCFPISCHWRLMVIVDMEMTHFSTMILTFCDWLHRIRMKPHGWWVNFCAFFMPGEIILCCCYWYFVSSGNQRAFTLQIDSDVRGDSVSPNQSLFCFWMGIQIGCL